MARWRRFRAAWYLGIGALMVGVGLWRTVAGEGLVWLLFAAIGSAFFLLDGAHLHAAELDRRDRGS